MAKRLEHGDVTGKIVKTVLAWTEFEYGRATRDAITEQVSAAHGIDPAVLADAEAVMSYRVPETAYPIVVDHRGDYDAIFKAGLFSANVSAIGMFALGMVRLLGGVKFAYQKVADVTERFANTGRMTCIESQAGRALLEFTMYDDLECTVYGCDYRRGILASVPLSFRRPEAARVKHVRCQARGAEACLYDVTWDE